jgi:hypothetical protein
MFSPASEGATRAEWSADITIQTVHGPGAQPPALVLKPNLI